MYGVVAIFIAVVITLAPTRFVRSEQRDMAILKSLGLTSAMLRRAFAMRVSLIVLLGAFAGLFLSCVCADQIISQIVGLFGIGAFRSGFSLQGYVFPALAVTLLFSVFAYLGSGRLKLPPRMRRLLKLPPARCSLARKAIFTRFIFTTMIRR